MEAAAGKNPVSHVGKLYNLLVHQLAAKIHQSIEGIEEVNVWLCSQIGSPVDVPWYASAQVALGKGTKMNDVAQAIDDLIHEELSCIGSFSERVCRGELPVC